MEQTIKEEIREGRAVTTEVMQEVNNKIAEERKEKLVKEMTEVTKKSQHSRKLALLKLQYQRDREAIIKEDLKKKTALDDSLAAGNVKTPEDYKKTKSQIDEETSKALLEVKKDYREQLEQLNKQFPGCYCYWDEIED